MKFITAFLLFAGLFYATTTLPKNGQLVFKVLDIGQGDSLYLQLPDKTDVVVDAGPDDRVLGQLGQAMPIGDREIELLVITHNHLDHIGGLPTILSHYKVDRIWLSDATYDTKEYAELMALLHQKLVPLTVVKMGDTTDFGPINFLVLHPPPGLAGVDPPDQHDATVALKVSYQHFCALLTGDLNFGHERQIIDFANQNHVSLACPILKVAHHGSATATSEAWLQATRPEVAIISVGLHNLYHHPAPSTLKRLTDFGVRIFRTDRNGTVTVTSDGQHYWTKSEK